MKCTDCVYNGLIYNQKSKNIDFKGLAAVINKLIFNKVYNMVEVDTVICIE